MSDIKKLSQDELSILLEELGQPKFRAKQLYEWLHVHNAVSYDDMTNLPKSLREVLSERFPMFEPEVINKQVSVDKTRKYVIGLEGGTCVECVGIVSDQHSDLDEGDVRERITVCFSTQAGCQMECSFCATGKEEFGRNLTSQEMVDQLVIVQNDFRKDNKTARISNAVAMGQGEPFLNYDNLIDALKVINDPQGLNIGARHITVSTCGIIEGVYRFAEEPEQFRLAVSLHSAIQEVRNKIMPRLSNQPLNKLKEALLDYCLVKHRRVTFEYMMIQGVNDKDEDLEALIKFCDGLLCHINLIPLNVVEDSIYHPSSQDKMRLWERYLDEAGVPVSIRYSKGSDIAGACGQLKNQM